MDRVATRTDPLQRGESYLYDNNGNLRQVTDRKGQLTTYTYDALDRLTQVTYADTSTTVYTYDAGDRLTQIADSLAGAITRVYDGLDRLTSETTPQGAVSYTYDATDRRATMTVAGQPEVTYVCDNVDRLTTIAQSGATVSFAYDAAGNRTGVGGTWARTNLPPALASATYDAANQIATWSGTAFSYDANGNLTSDGARTFIWNARDELTAITGAVSASFAYDGAGRRTTRTVTAATTGFVYDGLNPMQEQVGGSPVANLLTGLGIDEYFRRTDAAGARDYLTDALGSPLALADSTGTVQTTYTYEPFGAPTPGGAPSTRIQSPSREATAICMLTCPTGSRHCVIRAGLWHSCRRQRAGGRTAARTRLYRGG
jgi:YD repeat-containing protein